MICADEDYVLEAKKLKGEKANSILSLIIFNLIADNKLEDKFEFHDLVEVLLKDCLVKQDGLIYELYCDIYTTKFA